MAKLSELCDIQYGYAFDSSAFTKDNTYPQLARIRDVKRGYSETFYNGNFPEEYVLSAGDLLIGMDGEFNIARWKVNGALLNQRVCKIVAKDNVDEEFLRFALSKALKVIEERASFVTVKHLSAKELNKLEIPVPTYVKQKKISAILRRLEKIITSRQTELNKLNELVKARFVEMFESNREQWDQRKLSDCCNDSNDIKCGPFGSQLHAEDYCQEGVPVYGIPEVNAQFKVRPKLYITKEKAEELTAYSLLKGDIAVSRKGNVGQAALFDDAQSEGIIHSDVLRIRLNQQIMQPLYLVGELHYSQRVLHQIQSVSSGAIMPGTNVKKLKSIIVDVPPLELQNEYADFVDQVDKSKAAIQKSIDETQFLYDSLMQKYFG